MKVKAFTLVELLIVVIIVAVLSAIALPIFRQNSVKAKEASLKSSLSLLRNAVSQFEIEHNCSPDDLEDLTDPGPPIDCWLSSGIKTVFAPRAWKSSPLVWPGPDDPSQTGIGTMPKDPISRNNYLISRPAGGRMIVRSSASGFDSRGVAFSSY